jgi:hypothetical protein
VGFFGTIQKRSQWSRFVRTINRGLTLYLPFPRGGIADSRSQSIFHIGTAIYQRKTNSRMTVHYRLYPGALIVFLLSDPTGPAAHLGCFRTTYVAPIFTYHRLTAFESSGPESDPSISTSNSLIHRGHPRHSGACVASVILVCNFDSTYPGNYGICSGAF